MADDMTPIHGGGESDEFSRLEDELGRLAREMVDADAHLETPPPDLWSSIEAETRSMAHGGSPPEVDDGLSSEPDNISPLESVGTARLRTSRIGTPRGFGHPPPTPVVSRPFARRPRTGLYGIPAALAAAAVLALVLATGAALIVRAADAGEIVAQAALTNDGLPVALDGSGTALLRQKGGDLYLDLDLPDLSAEDQGAFYEVWMIDSNVEGMISLGGLGQPGGDTARIDLPDNIDQAAFPVVDISVEPLDGDPTHSGQSVLRGVLSEATDD